MGFWDIIGLIISGAIIGALARLFLPGKQNIGCLVTVCVGVIGCLIGYWIAAGLGVAETSGFDWSRWIISVIVSVVLVAATSAIMQKRE